MSYAEKFLKSKGQDCIINRLVPVNTKVSIKQSTNSTRDLGAREGYWQGLMLEEVNLQSGELIIIGNDKYLIQSSNHDHASKECAFFCAKCNSIINHKRYVKTADSENNLIYTWQILNSDVPCYGEIVTYRLRQVDPGLLDSTKYVFQVPKALDVKLLDRFAFNGTNYQVASIDSIGLDGVVRVQAESDLRP